MDRKPADEPTVERTTAKRATVERWDDGHTDRHVDLRARPSRPHTDRQTSSKREDSERAYAASARTTSV